MLDDAEKKRRFKKIVVEYGTPTQVKSFVAKTGHAINISHKRMNEYQ